MYKSFEERQKIYEDATKILKYKIPFYLLAFKDEAAERIYNGDLTEEELATIINPFRIE